MRRAGVCITAPPTQLKEMSPPLPIKCQRKPVEAASQTVPNCDFHSQAWRKHIVSGPRSRHLGLGEPSRLLGANQKERAHLPPTGSLVGTVPVSPPSPGSLTRQVHARPSHETHPANHPGPDSHKAAPCSPPSAAAKKLQEGLQEAHTATKTPGSSSADVIWEPASPQEAATCLA